MNKNKPFVSKKKIAEYDTRCPMSSHRVGVFGWLQGELKLWLSLKTSLGNRGSLPSSALLKSVTSY